MDRDSDSVFGDWNWDVLAGYLSHRRATTGARRSLSRTGLTTESHLIPLNLIKVSRVQAKITPRLAVICWLFDLQRGWQFSRNARKNP